MTPYILLCICFFTGSIINSLRFGNEVRIAHYFKTYIVFFMFYLPLVIVSGFRYKVGTDYNTYENIFYQIINGNNDLKSLNIEWGYYILNKIGMFLFENPQIIFLLSTIIIITFYTLGIIRRSNDIIFSFWTFLGLGMFFNSMNGLRQFIAISIIFYAYSFLEKDKFRSFILLGLVACLFNTTAIIPLFAGFVIKFLPNRIFFISSGVISFIALVSSNIITNILYKYGIYTFYLNNSQSFMNGGLSYFNILLALIAITMTLFFYKNLGEEKEIFIRFKLIWIGFLLVTCFSNFGDLAVRIAFYFTSTYIVLFANLVNKIHDKKISSIIKFICYGLFLFITFYLLINNNNTGLKLLPFSFRSVF